MPPENPRALHWAAARTPVSRLVGAGAASAALVGLGLLWVAFTAIRGPGAVVVLALALGSVLSAGWLALAWLGARGLRYSLGTQALVIDWRDEQIVVPYAAVEGLYAGSRLSGQTRPASFTLPGASMGEGRHHQFGRLRYFATHDAPAGLLVLVTQGQGFVITPHDPGPFRAALVGHLESADLVDPPPTVSTAQNAGSRWSLLRDRWVLGSGAAALVLFFLLTAWLQVRIPFLPPQIPLRWDGSGIPIEVGEPDDLLRIPLFALAMLIASVAAAGYLRPHETLLARVLVGGSVATGLVVLLAGFRLAQ